MTEEEILHRTKQHEAFAEVLTQLFKDNPVPEYSHESYNAVRESAIRKARAGLYCDYNALKGMHFWREQLKENARLDWRVPEEHVYSAHLLIYG